jgi:hypothetical protein
MKYFSGEQQKRQILYLSKSNFISSHNNSSINDNNSYINEDNVRIIMNGSITLSTKYNVGFDKSAACELCDLPINGVINDTCSMCSAIYIDIDDGEIIAIGSLGDLQIYYMNYCDIYATDANNLYLYKLVICGFRGGRDGIMKFNNLNNRILEKIYITLKNYLIRDVIHVIIEYYMKVNLVRDEIAALFGDDLVKYY